MNIPGTTRIRLEKAAADSGFDLERPTANGWLGFASSHAPIELWLGVDAQERPVAALSRSDVAAVLVPEFGDASPVRPDGALASVRANEVAGLVPLLRRTYQLARTLPNALLAVFEAKTAGLPRTTEAERFVVQRVGQGVFRAGLMEYWDGKCAISGLAVPELLRASHIKPWAACETDEERLDVFNGLLLASHLDAAFDAGFFTISDDGTVVVSDTLAYPDRALAGLAEPLRLERLTPAHRRYLEWHRREEFRAGHTPTIQSNPR